MQSEIHIGQASVGGKLFVRHLCHGDQLIVDRILYGGVVRGFGVESQFVVPCMFSPGEAYGNKDMVVVRIAERAVDGAYQSAIVVFGQAFRSRLFGAKWLMMVVL